MIFLIASETRCIEIEANDLNSALEEGMTSLNQHDFIHGNVIGIEKPIDLFGLKSLERKFIIQTGELFECGLPCNMEKVMLKHIQNLIKNGAVQ